MPLPVRLLLSAVSLQNVSSQLLLTGGRCFADGLRLDDRTTEVRVPRPGYRDVASGLGRDHRLVGSEQIGRDSRVKRDDVDLPAATVVGAVTGGDAGDSKLARCAVGHLVE